MAVDVSVIIPTYRRNRELSEAIASVCAQAGATFEIVVVDDCPDGSAELLVKGLSDPRIRYLRNPRPTGGVPSVVRNLGWPLASGRFLHFLDDDDIVPPGHYAAVIAAFEQQPRIGMIFGRIAPFGAGPQVQLRHERDFFSRAAANSIACARLGPKLGFAGQMLFDLPLLVCSANIVRRECVAEIGGFDPDIRLMEDADFHVRVIRKYGACFLDRPALSYRIGSPSLMHAARPTAEQLREQRKGRHRMRLKYRREHGALEFYALALLTRAMRTARLRPRRWKARSALPT